jgi:hypothetical protein
MFSSNKNMYFISEFNDQQKTHNQLSTLSLLTAETQCQQPPQQLPPQQPQQQPQLQPQQQLQQPQQLQQKQPKNHKPKTSKHGGTKRKIFNNNFQIFLQIRTYNFCSFSPRFNKTLHNVPICWNISPGK